MFALLFLAAAAGPDPFDAVIAAPDSHHVLLENDRVRVLRVEVKPGATEPVHTHRWSSIMYFEQPQPITYIEYRLVNGKPEPVRSVDAPALPTTQTVWGDPEGLHAIRNRGAAPFVAVRAEFKDSVAAVAPEEGVAPAP